MSDIYVLSAVAVMAIVTYGTRCIPLVLFKKKINNTFWYSFLNYTPYGVLSALIIPDVFTSTAGFASAAVGFFAAFILAFFKRGLLTVSLGACASVFIAERIIENLF